MLDMGRPTYNEAAMTQDTTPMIRKNLFLPHSLIQRTEALAESSGASFAEVVRRALAAYEAPFEGARNNDIEPLLTRLAQVNRDTIAQIDRLISTLDREDTKGEPVSGNER